jgi:hypothetical protein
LSHLRFLEIYINRDCSNTATDHEFDFLSPLIDSLCINPTSPATLEHLKLNIRFHCNPFDLDTFYNALRDGVCIPLNSLTTHPTGSRLQRVDISIEHSYCEDDDMTELYDGDLPELYDEDIVSMVHDGLPLLHTKGILFVEAALLSN